MTSAIVKKRSIAIRDRKTSVSLENEFWGALKEIATSQQKTLSQLLDAIESARQPSSNLSSTIRLFVLGHYRAIASSIPDYAPQPLILRPGR